MKNAQLVFYTLLAFLFLFSTSKFARAQTFKDSVENYNRTGQMASGPHVADTQENLLCTFLLGLGADPLCTPPSLLADAQQNSVLGVINSGIAYTFAPAADPVAYIADIKSHMGFASPVYAQGIGFNGLSPLLEIWKAFRNIAYGLLIIVMVVVGFMVIFRMKIDPRTVVTIQSAIPRIIITLLLITFSYAIVGLLIDVMYLIIFGAILALGKFNPTIVQNFSGGGLTNLVGAVFTTGQGAVNSLSDFFGLGGVPSVVTGILAGLVVGFTGIALGPLAIPAGLIAGGAGAALGAALPKLLSHLLIYIVILFAMVRIFFMLLTSWIQIILALLFGPFQLMVGAIPGVNSFGSWFKNLIANLAVFPITVLLLLIGTMLSGAQNGALWRPPGLGGTTGEGVAGLISLGIVLTIPTIVNAFKEALKTRPIAPVGLGAIFAPLSSTLNTGLQLVNTQYYLSHSPIVQRIGKGLGLIKPET